MLETFARVRTWETEQEGATGSEYLPELSSVTLEATVNESYTFEEWKLDGYEGTGFTWSSLETTTGYGNAQATLYQQRDLLGNDWSVASYNYAASGSSHETLTRETNLNEDVTGPNSVYWSNITTTLEEATERTFGLTEEGTRSAAGTFTFTDYSETGSLSKDSLLTSHATGLDSWTAEVDPEFPTFPAWGWETWDGERTQHKTVSESNTYEGSGTLEAFSYSEYTHDWTEVSNSTYHKDGDADGSPHPYYTDHTVDTLSSENRQRHTTGSGTAGLTTHTFDWSYSHEDTRWGGLDYDDEDSESSSHTFTLIDPKPTGLLDHPNNVEGHLAIGKNLDGLGLLQGYRGDVKSSSIVPTPEAQVVAADWGESEGEDIQVSVNGDPVQQGRMDAGQGIGRAQRVLPKLIDDPVFYIDEDSEDMKYLRILQETTNNRLDERTKGDILEAAEDIALRQQIIEEAERNLRQHLRMDMQDGRAYKNQDQAEPYNDAKLSKAVVPMQSGADTPGESIGQFGNALEVLGETVFYTALAAGSFMIQGPDDLLINLLLSKGYRVFRGAMQLASGKVRQVAIAVNRDGKLLMKRELKELRKEALLASKSSKKVDVPDGHTMQRRGGEPGFKSAEQRKQLESLKNHLKSQLSGKQREAFKKAVERAKIGEQFMDKETLEAIFYDIRDNVKP